MSKRSLAVVVLVLLCAAAAPARADVQKAPYLLFTGQAASMDVLWQSTVTETSVIRWGTDTGYGLGQATSVEYGSDHQHRYTIAGLAPDTVYHYQVDGFGAGSFRTAPSSAATSVVLWALADTQTDPVVHQAIAEAIRAAYLAAPERQTLLLHAGDWTDEDLEATWSSQFFLPGVDYPHLVAQYAELPMVGGRGNHEGAGNVFRKYFPFPWVDDFSWSFDYGPVHVVVVDQYVDFAPGSAQYAWLAADLAATTRPWKIVVMHEPAWTASGGIAGDDTAVQAALHPLFLQHQVDLVLAGHNHCYARAVIDGIQYLTIGGAGGELIEPAPSTPNVVTAVSDYHYVAFDVDGATLTLTARRATGALIEEVALVHDLEAPTVAITAPASGATVAGTVAVTATATDDVGVTAVDFFVDGTAIGSASGTPLSVPWDTGGVASGSHTLLAHARDAAGRVGVSPGVTVTVSGGGADTQAPTAAITAPAAGATVAGVVAVTASASDNVGVVRVDLLVDGAAVASATAAPSAFAWDSASAANGAHALAVRAFDAAGNAGTSAAIGITVANPQPLSNGVALTVGGAAGSQARFYVDVPAGASNLVIATSGGSGDADLYTRPGAPPTLTSYTCRPYLDGNVETCSVAAPAAGRYHVMLVGYAAFSGVALRATYATPDTTPPSVSLTAPAAGATVSGAVTVSASATDDVGVSRVEFHVDGALLAIDTTSPYGASWSTATAANGPHALTARAYDAAGNVGASAAVSVAVANAGTDTQAPTAAVTAPAAGATVTGVVAVTASASDNVGVVRVDLLVDGAAVASTTAVPSAFAWDSASAANGAHALAVRAFDAAGNAGTSAAIGVTVDNSQPLTNGVPLTVGGATGSQARFHVDVPAGASNLVIGTSGGSGDADLYTRSGAPPTLTSYDCRPWLDGNVETCSVAAPAAGRYHVMLVGYTAYSGVALRATYTATGTTPDTTPPSVSVTAPASGATVSGAVTVSASATDDVGVSRVEFHVDGTLLATDTTSPFGTTWATALVPSGVHTLTARAYDAAGNVGTSAAVAVTVDNGTPLASGVTVTLAGAAGSQTRFYVDVPAGASNLVIGTSGGSGDADLYTRSGAPPTLTSYACRPWLDGNVETCSVAAPAAGRYFIMIHGYAAYGGVGLRASFTPGD